MRNANCQSFAQPAVVRKRTSTFSALLIQVLAKSQTQKFVLRSKRRTSDRQTSSTFRKADYFQSRGRTTMCFAEFLLEPPKGSVIRLCRDTVKDVHWLMVGHQPKQASVMSAVQSSSVLVHCDGRSAHCELGVTDGQLA